jgi:hypothetical protein
VGVSAQEIELSEQDFSFLRRTFQQLHTTYGWPGSANYRFMSEGAAILIWDGKDRGGVDWFVSAPSVSDLRKLLAKIWHCGNLARSMYGTDAKAEEVLRELRSRAGEHHITNG